VEAFDAGGRDSFRAKGEAAMLVEAGRGGVGGTFDEARIEMIEDGAKEPAAQAATAEGDGGGDLVKSDFPVRVLRDAAGG
jgi:hypothetical protein